MQNKLTVFNSSEKVKSLRDDKTQLFKISSFDPGFNSLFNELSLKSYSNVVATTGDTHAGKSTLIKELQELTGCSENSKRPNIGEEEDVDQAPTTANVNYYKTREEGEDVLFLDVEGSNAGDLLPVDEQQDVERNYKQYGFSSISEYMEMRRRSSEEHLSRLAYAISDVVMYVSGTSFANNISKQRAANYIVENATRNIGDILKPSLILVFNISKIVYETVEFATETFFKTHDVDRGLLDYYSTVKVVFIPDTGSKSVIVHSPTGNKDKRNADTVFESQMKVLRSAINDSLKHQRDLKKQNGALLTYQAWSILFECSVNMLNKTRPFVLSSMISDAITDSKDAEYKISKKVFNNIIQYAPHNPETYRKALYHSLRMIVAVFFRELCEKGASGEIGLENVLSPSRKLEILKHLDRQAESLIVSSTPCIPCAKIFTVNPKNKAPSDYSCSYSKCTHPPNEHKFVNVQDYYGNNMITSVFRKLVDMKKTNVTEKGSFQQPTVDVKALKKEVSQLFERIFTYYHNTKPSFTNFMCEIYKLQHLISYESTSYINGLTFVEDKCWIDEGECAVCLNHRDKLNRRICGHELCSFCCEFENSCSKTGKSFLVEDTKADTCVQCVLNGQKIRHNLK